MSPRVAARQRSIRSLTLLLCGLLCVLLAMPPLCPRLLFFTAFSASLSCGSPGRPPERTPDVATEVVVPTGPALDPSASAATTSSAESSPPVGWSDEAGTGFPTGRWRGTCGDPGPIWDAVHGHLKFEAEGELLSVRGTLRFVKRVTRANLAGKRDGNRFRLRGTLVELHGLRTTWQVELTIEAPGEGTSPLRVSLEELPSSGASPNHMCSFLWPHAGQRAP